MAVFVALLLAVTMVPAAGAQTAFADEQFVVDGLTYKAVDGGAVLVGFEDGGALGDDVTVPEKVSGEAGELTVVGVAIAEGQSAPGVKALALPQTVENIDTKSLAAALPGLAAVNVDGTAGAYSSANGLLFRQADEAASSDGSTVKVANRELVWTPPATVIARIPGTCKSVAAGAFTDAKALETIMAFSTVESIARPEKDSEGNVTREGAFTDEQVSRVNIVIPISATVQPEGADRISTDVFLSEQVGLDVKQTPWCNYGFDIKRFTVGIPCGSTSVTVAVPEDGVVETPVITVGDYVGYPQWNPKPDEVDWPADGLVFEYKADMTVSVRWDGNKEAIPSHLELPAYVIENGVKTAVTEIAPNAFEGATQLKSVVVPEGVTTIGESAFAGCSGLKSASFPSTLKTIDYAAFKGAGLEEVAIPNSVRTVGGEAFADCMSLENVESNDLAMIGQNAFANSPVGESAVQVEENYQEQIDSSISPYASYNSKVFLGAYALCDNTVCPVPESKFQIKGGPTDDSLLGDTIDNAFPYDYSNHGGVIGTWGTGASSGVDVLHCSGGGTKLRIPNPDYVMAVKPIPGVKALKWYYQWVDGDITHHPNPAGSWQEITSGTIAYPATAPSQYGWVLLVTYSTEYDATAHRVQFGTYVMPDGDQSSSPSSKTCLGCIEASDEYLGDDLCAELNDYSSPGHVGTWTLNRWSSLPLLHKSENGIKFRTEYADWVVQVTPSNGLKADKWLYCWVEGTKPQNPTVEWNEIEEGYIPYPDRISSINDYQGTPTWTLLITYIAKDINLTFDYGWDGAEGGQVHTVNGLIENSLYQYGGAPVRAGFNFLGWCVKNEDGTTNYERIDYEEYENTAVSPSETVNNCLIVPWCSTTYLAMWGYDISYCDSDGVEMAAQQNLIDGRDETLPTSGAGTETDTDIEKAVASKVPIGYTFNGWVKGASDNPYSDAVKSVSGIDGLEKVNFDSSSCVYRLYIANIPTEQEISVNFPGEWVGNGGTARSMTMKVDAKVTRDGEDVTEFENPSLELKTGSTTGTFKARTNDTVVLTLTTETGYWLDTRNTQVKFGGVLQSVSASQADGSLDTWTLTFKMPETNATSGHVAVTAAAKLPYDGEGGTYLYDFTNVDGWYKDTPPTEGDRVSFTTGTEAKLKQPTRQGFWFTGWVCTNVGDYNGLKDAANGEGGYGWSNGVGDPDAKLFSISACAYGDLELQATWTPKVYQVNYNVDSTFDAKANEGAGGNLVSGLDTSYYVHPAARGAIATGSGNEWTLKDGGDSALIGTDLHYVDKDGNTQEVNADILNFTFRVPSDLAGFQYEGWCTSDESTLKPGNMPDAANGPWKEFAASAGESGDNIAAIFQAPDDSEPNTVPDGAEGYSHGYCAYNSATVYGVWSRVGQVNITLETTDPAEVTAKKVDDGLAVKIGDASSDDGEGGTKSQQIEYWIGRGLFVYGAIQNKTADHTTYGDYQNALTKDDKLRDTDLQFDELNRTGFRFLGWGTRNADGSPKDVYVRYCESAGNDGMDRVKGFYLTKAGMDHVRGWESASPAGLAETWQALWEIRTYDVALRLPAAAVTTTSVDLVTDGSDKYGWREMSGENAGWYEAKKRWSYWDVIDVPRNSHGGAYEKRSNFYTYEGWYLTASAGKGDSGMNALMVEDAPVNGGFRVMESSVAAGDGAKTTVDFGTTGASTNLLYGKEPAAGEVAITKEWVDGAGYTDTSGVKKADGETVLWLNFTPVIINVTAPVGVFLAGDEPYVVGSDPRKHLETEAKFTVRESTHNLVLTGVTATDVKDASVDKDKRNTTSWTAGVTDIETAGAGEKGLCGQLLSVPNQSATASVTGKTAGDRYEDIYNSRVFWVSPTSTVGAYDKESQQTPGTSNTDKRRYLGFGLANGDNKLYDDPDTPGAAVDKGENDLSAFTLKMPGLTVGGVAQGQTSAADAEAGRALESVANATEGYVDFKFYYGLDLRKCDFNLGAIQSMIDEAQREAESGEVDGTAYNDGWQYNQTQKLPLVRLMFTFAVERQGLVSYSARLGDGVETYDANAANAIAAQQEVPEVAFGGWSE